jgi:hypothetical protein
MASRAANRAVDPGALRWGGPGLYARGPEGGGLIVGTDCRPLAPGRGGGRTMARAARSLCAQGTHHTSAKPSAAVQAAYAMRLGGRPKEDERPGGHLAPRIDRLGAVGDRCLDRRGGHEPARCLAVASPQRYGIRFDRGGGRRTLPRTHCPYLRGPLSSRRLPATRTRRTGGAGILSVVAKSSLDEFDERASSLGVEQ